MTDTIKRKVRREDVKMCPSPLFLKNPYAYNPDEATSLKEWKKLIRDSVSEWRVVEDGPGNTGY